MSYSKEQISKAIWQTIAFFDIFSYPLTLFELWQYCPLPLAGPADIAQALSDLSLKGKVETKQGFYFLLGREKIIAQRQRRFNYTQYKIKRAQRIVKIFRFIPWIKFIAIGNNIGSFNLRVGSDIDLFIITKAQRIWLTRLFSVGIAMILGVRPTKQNSQDTICLSFYLSEDALNLNKFLLPSQPAKQKSAWERDPYFIFWLSGLIPLLDRGEYFAKIFSANSWLKQALPNWQPPNYIILPLLSVNLPRWYQRIFDSLLGSLEWIAELIQLHIMPEQTRKMLNQDSRVMANEQTIKLHINDRRQEFRQKYQEKNKVIA